MGRSWAGAALALGMGLGAARAQEPARPGPEPVLPVTTELVRIDVVVTDKGGHPKSGLTGADFVVLEDGVPQPIAQFEAFTTPGAAPSAATNTAEPPRQRFPTPTSPAPASAAGRYVVLAVDDVHMEAHNLLRIKKTLERFLERDLAAEDQVAVVTTSGGMSQELTGDRQALERTVARLSVRDRRAKWSGAPYMSEYQAEQIALGDPEALRVAVEQIRNERQSPGAEGEARMFARTMLAESIHNARITLETLDGVVRGLSRLRGRKVVVLVSDGFLTGLRVQGGAGFDLRRIVDAGTRAGVVIYSLDSRGLVATSSGVAASSRMPVTASTFGAQQELERASELAVHDAMGALADDTGGFLAANTNDLVGGLRRILKDTETYYLIAYEPANAKRDGAFRKVEVRLPGLRDVRIRHRKGYFATNDAKPVLAPSPNGASAAGDSGAPGADRPSLELTAALASPTPLDGLPVRLSADFVSPDGVSLQVVVSGRVDLGGVPFQDTGGRHVATVDAASAVFDETGTLVGRLEPEHAALELTNATREQAVESGLLYEKAAPLRPGRYRVGFAARDETLGRLGAASAWVEIPDLGQGKLTLSSLFLLRRGRSSEETAPLASAGALALRSAQAWPRFKRGESLYLQAFAYNPGRDASGQADLVTETEIWRGDERLASTPPEPMAAAAAGSPPIPRTQSIKLERFAPGDYEIRVVVTDRLAHAMASRRLGLIIE